MKRLVIPALCAGLGLIALPTFAQQTPPDRIAPPVWANQPVVETYGRAALKVPANRASFGAAFVEVNRESKAASDKAVARARAALDSVRSALGANGRVRSSVSVAPYYQQYRDGEGVRVQNDRPDRVEGYQASARLDVTIEADDADPALVGRVRAAALAGGPEIVDELNYTLQVTPALMSEAMRLAVEDGRARAQAMASAAGGSLGDLLVMQQNQGPCLGVRTGASPVNEQRGSRTAAAGSGQPYELPSDAEFTPVVASVCLVYKLMK